MKKKLLDFNDHTAISPVFDSGAQKKCDYYLKNFNSKTDWLSFLIAMVCKTWLLYDLSGSALWEKTGGDVEINEKNILFKFKNQKAHF